MTQFDEEVEQPENKSPLLSHGVQLFVLGIFCGSLMRTCAKLVLQDVDQFVALQLRMSITVLISSVNLFRQRQSNVLGQPGHKLLLLIRGILGFFMLSTSFFALQHMPLPDHSSIGFLQPLVVVAIARATLHEKMTGKQIACSVMALLGVLVIAQPTFIFGGASKAPTDHLRSLAVILSLIAVFEGAIVQVILRKIKDTPALVSVANSAAVCAIFSTVVILIRGREHMQYPTTLRSCALLLGMGTFGFMRQWLNVKALQHETASALSSWRYTTLVWAILWEYLIWHDLPSIWTWLGSVLVMVPVLYSAHLGRQQAVGSKAAEAASGLPEAQPALPLEPVNAA